MGRRGPAGLEDRPRKSHDALHLRRCESADRAGTSGRRAGDAGLGRRWSAGAPRAARRRNRVLHVGPGQPVDRSAAGRRRRRRDRGGSLDLDLGWPRLAAGDEAVATGRHRVSDGRVGVGPGRPAHQLDRAGRRADDGHPRRLGPSDDDLRAQRGRQPGGLRSVERLGDVPQARRRSGRVRRVAGPRCRRTDRGRGRTGERQHAAPGRRPHARRDGAGDAGHRSLVRRRADHDLRLGRPRPAVVRGAHGRSGDGLLGDARVGPAGPARRAPADPDVRCADRALLSVRPDRPAVGGDRVGRGSRSSAGKTRPSGSRQRRGREGWTSAAAPARSRSSWTRTGRCGASST